MAHPTGSDSPVASGSPAHHTMTGSPIMTMQVKDASILIGAIPSRRRWSILLVSYTHVLLTAGVVFGWAALEPFYDDLSQSRRDLIFTVAASCNYLSNLLFGPFLDKYGGVKLSLLACLMMILGTVGMLAAEVQGIGDNTRFVLVLLGFGMLGFAGPGVQMPTLRCELLFPESTALVTSINASLFDASCVVFLVFKVFTIWAPSVTVWSLFMGYLVLMILCLVSGQLLFRDLDTVHAWACERQPLVEDGVESQSGIRNQSFGQVLRSFKFAYLATFCAVGILRLNFVVMTINAQLADMFGQGTDTFETLSTLFSTLLPMGGFAAPLTAILIGRYQRQSYRVTLALGIVYGLCFAFSSIWCQVIAYIIISISRQLTYSIVFALTSQLFGQEHLGKLLAANNVIVFLVGLLQYPIAQLKGSAVLPTWFAVDMLMTALVVPLLFSNGGL